MKDAIDINVILDRSGSMSSIKNDVIGGFNSFLKKQKETPGEGTISLYRFDSTYEVVYQNVNIKDARLLDQNDLVPRGSTALYDAIGKTIDSVGIRLRNLPEDQRPNQVLVIVITDGEENASREYVPHDPYVPLEYFNIVRQPMNSSNKSDKICNMIKHQQEKYNWQFMFIGANIDAVLSGGKIGISQKTSATFNANAQSVDSTFNLMSAKVSGYRTTKSVEALSYSASDRSEMRK